MKKLKLYLDTTIWNYPFETHSPERTAETLEFFKMVRMGLYEVFYSEMVAREIEATQTPRRHLMDQLISEVAPQMLEATNEVEQLALEYLNKSVLPKKSRFDAFHVAYSTIYQMDALVSWNFQHLANMNRRNRVLTVNREKGYNHLLELVTPLEVFSDEKN